MRTVVSDRWSVVSCLIVVMVFACGQAEAQVRVMPGEVKDTRRTDGFFNKLEVEMKVIGEVLSEARGIRVKVLKAVDETGKNLIPEKEKDNEFKEVDASDQGSVKVELELRNPARRALSVTEISGTLELFVPAKDPKAIVTVPDLAAAIGQPFASPGLKAAGIEVAIWNKQQYEARRKTEEEKLKKAFEERKKKAGESGAGAEDLGEALAGGLMKVFGGLFSAMTDMSENGIAIQINDPKRQVISIEFQDREGKAIGHQGRTTLGGEERTMIFDFENKLPEGTKVKLYLMTPASVIRSPFRLTGVALP